MRIDDDENLYVRNGEILLYTQEKEITSEVKKIMGVYLHEFRSNKDFVKKSIELFHLLTFLEINKELNRIDEIIPNEPGDFLVKKSGKQILYEIVTVFGDKEAKAITDDVKKLLNSDKLKTDDSITTSYPVMDVVKLKSQFTKVLNAKKNKDYFSEYENVILLLVTSEHDRSGTVAWYLVEDVQSDIQEFLEVTGSSIKTINYFKSGKDGNPETNDIEYEIKIYNTYFK